MIPNNPNFADDSSIEETITFAELPPKSVAGIESMAIGGVDLDGGEFTRRNQVYWSITPIGSGIGTESRFELRKWDGVSWSLEHSIDSEFTDSSTFEDLSLAFDKYNNMFVAYKDHTGINLFWYDSRVGSYNTIPYGDGATPRVYYDGGANVIHSTSDVVFMYTLNQILYTSNSSEFFVYKYNTLPVNENVGIKDIGITVTGKLQIVFHKVPFDTYNHIVELCKNDTVWTPLVKSGNNIKRV